MISTILVALLALLLGAAFCFGGYRFFRILMPIWGFFAGLNWGATAVALLLGGGFLADVLGWMVGLVAGLILAVLAYAYYYVAVVILGASVGYNLGAGLMTAIGVPPGLIPALVGVSAAIMIALLVLLLRIPKLLLVVLGALGGAALMVTGGLLLLGQIPLENLQAGTVAAFIETSVLWTLVWLGLAVAGVAAQLQAARRYTAK